MPKREQNHSNKTCKDPNEWGKIPGGQKELAVSYTDYYTREVTPEIYIRKFIRTVHYFVKS